MIAPSNTYRIFLATQPVDFRKGMDGVYRPSEILLMLQGVKCSHE